MRHLITAGRRARLILLAAVAAIAACADDPTIPRPTLSLLPDALTLLEGDTARFAAAVRGPQDPGATIVWTSADTTVATVDLDGFVRARSPGATDVRAELGGAFAAARVEVGPAHLVGAGDIAVCGATGDDQTAAMLDTLPGIVFTTGDNAYLSGTPQQFTDCYHPTWGRHRGRTRPSPGNHDYLTAGASGYFDYFGAAAGPSGLGWYSYDVGAWHVVSLNSEVPVGPGSAQMDWLLADLAAHPAPCVLAYWHRPRFSSGANHGNSVGMQPLWEALYAADADVVLAGHDHTYERFGLQTPAGAADPARGIRQFVVGTGGGTLYAFATPQPNSEFRFSATYGVLLLRLRPAGYDWTYAAVDGSVPDAGVGACH